MYLRNSSAIRLILCERWAAQHQKMGILTHIAGINQSGMSITGAGTDCVQVLGVATLTMGHVACTDHVVWLAEAYRARYAAQPHSLCGSVSLVAINFNANLRKKIGIAYPAEKRMDLCFCPRITR